MMILHCIMQEIERRSNIDEEQRIESTTKNSKQDFVSWAWNNIIILFCLVDKTFVESNILRWKKK